jgi:hypothetical protein
MPRDERPANDPPEEWTEPPPDREQTKVATVKVAKVGRVAGARRRQ